MLIEGQHKELTEEEVEDWVKAFERIDNGFPNNTDVEQVEKVLKFSPQIWENGHSQSGWVLQDYIETIEKSKSSIMFIKAEARHIKESLGYFSGNQIEKLIIDQILLCWMGVTHIERKVMDLMIQENSCGRDFWQNTLTRYQNRYLKSLEALARIRKLSKGIAFQVNIATNGSQQVNVNEVISRQG